MEEKWTRKLSFSAFEDIYVVESYVRNKKNQPFARLPSFHMCNTSLALCFVFRTEAHGKLLVKPKRFFFFLTKLHRQVPWIQIISASANLSVISLDLKALSRVSFLTIRIKRGITRRFLFSFDVQFIQMSDNILNNLI